MPLPSIRTPLLRYTALADILDSSEKPAEVVGLAEKALRLDPRNLERHLFNEAWSYSQMGRYEDAIPILKRHLARYPNNWAAHGLLVVDYTGLGREEEARQKRRKFCGLALTSPWIGGCRSLRRKINRS